jgi:hypothetical protein
MDIKPTNQQPISDDQELAKVLAGVNQQADAVAATPPADETPAPADTPVAAPEPIMPTPTISPAPSVATGSDDLEAIKKDALSELRPLVDKLDVAPEEKFDTYLLLLRSTDDHALIAPAHEAARGIADESRRAQALLDIIKEIDYLAGPQQPVA